MVVVDRGAKDAGARQFTAHGQDRRDEIVAAARTLFAANGYAATRMADIAEAAGVTKGLLYWYFDSKESLITEILRDARRQLRDDQREAVSGVDDPLERIYLGTAAAVRFVLGNFRLYQVTEAAVRSAARVLGESSQVHARDATATIAEGQRRGVIRTSDSAEAIAHANAGVVNHLCTNAFHGLLKGSTEEIAHAAARYVVHACAADAGSAGAITARYAVKRVKR